MEASYPALMRFWKDWGLRSMVLLSLFLQVALVILGNRRKSHREILTRVVVWSAYIAADSVATFALGLISNEITEIYQENHTTMDNNTQLTAFWAPFLLLHMGGPDTLTAYALEDNQLWLRHLLGLAVQTTISIYIMVMAWRPSSSKLSTLSIVMFFAGLIKYAERTWSLRYASNEILKERLVNSPSEYHHNTDCEDKVNDGYILQAGIFTDMNRLPVSLFDEDSISKEDELLMASGSMKVPHGLFSDTWLNSGDKHYSRVVFKRISYVSAFRIVDIQLGFIHDFLYTKAPLLATPWGIGLRLIPFFLISYTFVIFVITTLNPSHSSHDYSKIDLYMTLVLLIVAISLEIYATLVHLSSDRFLVWLKKHQYKNIKQVTTTPRWSDKLPQYCLRKGIIVEDTCFHKVILKLQLVRIFKLENLRYVSEMEVHEDLKNMVFQYIKAKVVVNNTSPTVFLTNPASIRKWLELSGCDIKESLWPSIITWHFATEIIYSEDKKTLNQDQYNNQYYYNRAVLISRYMLYLLVEYPSMISAEKGLVQFQYTRQHALERYRKNRRYGIYSSSFEANDEVDAKYVSMSLLKSAVDLSEKVKIMTVENTPGFITDGHENDIIIWRWRWKWEIISYVWLEILARAASRGKSSQHAEQLRRGGEFLTHVWLLMAHFGLTNHYQIQEFPETEVLFVK